MACSGTSRGNELQVLMLVSVGWCLVICVSFFEHFCMQFRDCKSTDDKSI